MINIGTDCSGIDAPLFALDNLGITYNYKFASEIDKYARMSLLANHSPEVLYEDVEIPRVLPKLDLYVCGFPCQPFSSLGLRKGSDDEREIFDYVLDAIYKTEPKVFILENVKGILSFKDYFSEIINKLSSFRTSEGVSSLNYDVNYSVYNTSDYGLPQNRKRVYIVGVLRSLKSIYQIPKFLPLKSNFVEQGVSKQEYPKYVRERLEVVKDTFFCNVNLHRLGSKIRNPNISGTITKNGTVWCIKEHRKATIKELLYLQGFPLDYKQVVSYRQMKQQIGNAMSVNVVQEILKECLFILCK